MLKLSIVTPEKKLLTDVEVTELTVPTEGGEIEILEGHAALMSTLSPGVLRYTLKNGNEKGKVVVSWGYCEVYKDTINILAETAERPEEIDLSRVEASIKKVEEQLANPTLSPLEIEELRWKREKAEVRLAVSKLTH